MIRDQSVDAIDRWATRGPIEPYDARPRSITWAALANLHFAGAVPAAEHVKNLGLWHPHIYTGRLLEFADIYRHHIVGTAGSVLQFGVRFGQDLVWLVKLRTLFEPHSVRHIVGFDTFAGHRGTDEVDGDDWIVQDGALDVPEGYESFLLDVLITHAAAGSFVGEDTGGTVAIVKGDVRATLPDVLTNDYRHLVVAAAFFDLDLYEPTRVALQALLPRLHKGSVLVFDELDAPRMPGETRALMDSVGLGSLNLKTGLWDTMSYAIYGEGND